MLPFLLIFLFFLSTALNRKLNLTGRNKVSLTFNQKLTRNQKFEKVIILTMNDVKNGIILINNKMEQAVAEHGH